MFTLPYSDVIYSIDSNTFMPFPFVRLTIAGQVRIITPDTSEKTIESILNSQVTKNYYSLYRWNEDLMVGYETEERPFVYVIADLESGRVKVNQSFRPDENGIPVMPYSYISESDLPQKMLSVVDPAVIENVARAKGDKASPLLKQLSQSHSADDNPILFFYDYRLNE